MSTAFNFTEPDDAANGLKLLAGGNLLYFLRQFPWIFLQNLLASSDFQSIEFCLWVLEALPSDFDDVFEGKMANKGTEDIIHIIRTVYSQAPEGTRSTDQLVRACVCNWN